MCTPMLALYTPGFFGHDKPPDPRPKFEAPRSESSGLLDLLELAESSFAAQKATAEDAAPRSLEGVDGPARAAERNTWLVC